MALATTPEQRRTALAIAGIGARYSESRVSVVCPQAGEVVDTHKEWIMAGQHVLMVSPTDEAACVFAGCLLFMKNSVFAIDTGMLVNALERNDLKELAPVYECEVLTLLSFYSSKWTSCPWTAGQRRLLEGFLASSVNRYDKNLVMRATDESLKWYSDDFTGLILPNTIIVK